jgi:hypothetical protein
VAAGGEPMSPQLLRIEAAFEVLPINATYFHKL